MKKTDICFGVSAVLAIFVLLICVEVEILNFLAGGYLPREDRNGKWRESPFVSEEMWRSIVSQEKNDETLLRRALTKAERRQMKNTVARAKSLNALRAAVSTHGLLQYLLAPLALVWSIFTALGRNRVKRGMAILFSLSNFIGMVLMFYRGYFTSLQW